MKPEKALGNLKVIRSFKAFKDDAQESSYFGEKTDVIELLNLFLFESEGTRSYRTYLRQARCVIS